MKQVSRRQFNAALAGAAAVAGTARAAERKPNIIFIILDDLGLYDLGCYGSTKIRTPHIDRLAREGMLFTQAYSGCSVCAPARSTLMTGQHMGHTPVRGNSGGISLRAEDYLMPQMLRDSGYVCGGFGKWGVGDLDTPGVPEKHGFQRFYGYYHQVHAHFFYPDYLIDTGRKVDLPGNFNHYKANPPEGVVDFSDKANAKRQFSAYLIVDEMKKFVRENKDKPFFLYLPWTIPHQRHEIPSTDPAWQLYKDKPWSMAARVHAAYCTMADRFVGDLMSELKELQIDDNTLLFFCSDNGAAAVYEGELDSAGTLKGKKTLLYEGGIRVPLIARWPGQIKAGSQTDAPVYFPDILPTVVEAAGTKQKMPKNVDGVSMLPELLGRGKVSRTREMYWEWNGAHFAPGYSVVNQAMRKGRYKIVRNVKNAPWELYDLAADPGETTDLAAKRPEIVRDMAAWVTANRADPPPQVEPSKPEGKKWR